LYANILNLLKGYVKMLRIGLLSLATASALFGGTIQSASLDLETYSLVKVEFDSAPTEAELSGYLADKNITIEHNQVGKQTENNISLTYVRTEGNTIYLGIASDDVSTIRGNTYNDLNLNLANDALTDFGGGTSNFELLQDLGDVVSGDFNVSNDIWNLITFPSGYQTNARELIKSNKVTMVWGWEYNGTAYNWASYPDKMVGGRGYWVRTRVAANTERNLNTVNVSDFNGTVLSDIDSTEINTTNFQDIIANTPYYDEWVLLGNSTGTDVEISATEETNTTTGTYYFDDLLNDERECYFVSIYHYDAEEEDWVNDTDSGATSTAIPKNSGMWVRQRLCNNE
jgi:hypothetical protein